MVIGLTLGFGSGHGLTGLGIYPPLSGESA